MSNNKVNIKVSKNIQESNYLLVKDILSTEFIGKNNKPITSRKSINISIDKIQRIELDHETETTPAVVILKYIDLISDKKVNVYISANRHIIFEVIEGDKFEVKLKMEHNSNSSLLSAIFTLIYAHEDNDEYLLPIFEFLFPKQYKHIVDAIEDNRKIDDDYEYIINLRNDELIYHIEKEPRFTSLTPDIQEIKEYEEKILKYDLYIKFKNEIIPSNQCSIIRNYIAKNIFKEQLNEKRNQYISIAEDILNDDFDIEKFVDSNMDRNIDSFRLYASDINYNYGGIKSYLKN